MNCLPEDSDNIIYFCICFALCILDIKLKKAQYSSNQLNKNQSPHHFTPMQVKQLEERNNNNLSITKVCQNWFLNVCLELDYRSWFLVKNLNLFASELFESVAFMTFSILVASKVRCRTPSSEKWVENLRLIFYLKNKKEIKLYLVYILTLAPSVGLYVGWSCVTLGL